eukprot:766266_1
MYLSMAGMSTTLIDKIDSGLKQYYKQRKRYNYILDDGIGKFKQFCEDNAFDDDAVQEELDLTDANECTLADFDDDDDDNHQFPFEINFDTKDEENDEIVKILKAIAKY